MTSAPRLSRVSAAIAIAFALAAQPALAAGYLKLGDIKGESSDRGHGGQIEIESWSWGETRAVGRSRATNSFASGVEREMKESGEKGGTEDINIGVGELQEVTISKSMDKSTPKLLESAVKGKVFASPAPRGSLTTLVPAGTCRVGARYPKATLDTGTMQFEMENVMVSSCSAHSGGSSEMRPMESISLNYGKIVWR